MTLLRFLTVLSGSTLLLSGCMGDLPHMRDVTARNTAGPVFMIPRDIPSQKFIIQSYERVYEKARPATIYIEGDGTYTIGLDMLSKGNPTPTDPVALRMAAQDESPNVIWLARPCQYNKGWKDGKQCPAEYSTSKRFSPEVIDSYNEVLDNIKAYYRTPSFNLVGYDGGAAIAVILGSQRADIDSIRTVAGVLDTKTMANLNGEIHTDDSLSPTDFAAGIANIPQRHFIGKLDTVTPPAVYNGFAQSVGQGQCLNVTLVDNADHQSGWVEQWKVLKTIPMDCAQFRADTPKPVKFDPTPLDGDKTHKHSGVIPDQGSKAD